jgi:hypothetical protein
VVPEGFAGRGFVFAEGDGLYGIDLDNCIADGELMPWAAEIVERFGGTYIETSPSGFGVKIWAVGDVKRGLSKRLGDKAAIAGRVPGVEIYGRGRYFAFTGQGWYAEEPTPQDESLAWLLAKYWPTTPALVAAVPTPPSRQVGSVVDRAAKYLAKVPPAVSGQGGHNRTFHAAGVLVHGFGLSVEDALPLMLEWNAACDPPWTEAEIERKLREAAKAPCNRPVGWLRDEELAPPDTDHVDLSGLMGAPSAEVVEPIAESPEEPIVDEWTPVDPGPFDAKLCDVPGFLGEFVQYDLATAKFPQPELSLGAALCTLATLTGRRVRDAADTRTNLFAVGLAPAGAGKENARKTAKAVLNAGGAVDMIGNERIASASGLLAALEVAPSSLFLVDEIGDLLAQMKAQGAKSHLANIESVLKSLYSSANTTYKGDAYANPKHTKIVEQPHMVLYGTTTPGAFWGGVSAANLEHGLIPRFMVFEGAHVDPKDATHAPVPESLKAKATVWQAFSPGVGDLQGVIVPNPVTVEESPIAKEIRMEHDAAIRARMKTDKNANAMLLWARCNEKAAKLALLRACSRMIPGICTDVKIDRWDWDWAKTLANYLTKRMAFRMFGRVYSTDEEGRKQRILSLFEPGKPLSLTQISRKTQYLTTRQRVEAIEDMVSAGLLTKLKKGGTGRPATYYQR